MPAGALDVYSRDRDILPFVHVGNGHENDKTSVEKVARDIVDQHGADACRPP